jgi:hypothetical protein
MPVITGALGEGTQIGVVRDGVEHPGRCAVLGDAHASEIGEMRPNRPASGSPVERCGLLRSPGRGEDLRDEQLWSPFPALLQTAELGMELVVFEHGAGETQPRHGLQPKHGTVLSRRHRLKHMCRPWKSSGRALRAAPSSILRSGLHTCFFCRSYPLLLRVIGRGISREPHWIVPSGTNSAKPARHLDHSAACSRVAALQRDCSTSAQRARSGLRSSLGADAAVRRSERRSCAAQTRCCWPSVGSISARSKQR